jgi:hypothetical protein
VAIQISPRDAVALHASLPCPHDAALKLESDSQETMMLQLQLCGFKDNAELRRQVQADLETLNGPLAVASAHITLQHQPEATPPCQALATLAVPGPDIHAAARDHTWPVTWRKVVRRLREQMEERCQTARLRNQPRVRASTGRRAK